MLPPAVRPGRVKWRESFALFDNALSELRAGGAAWELAQTHLAYAEARISRSKRGDRSKAEAHLAEAQLLLDELRLPVPPTPLTYGDLPSAARRFGLSGREIEVLQLVARGHRNQEIAEILSLSTHTISRHLENIFRKMDVGSRAEAVMQAATKGLLLPFNQAPN